MLTLPFLLLLAASATFEESYRAGLEALQSNHLGEARTNLENAANSRPDNAKVWLALAQTYWKLHESSKAEEAADKAARFSSGNPQVLNLLAIFYSETEAWPKACNAQSDYAATSSGDHAAVTRAMELCLQAHQPERAIRVAAGSRDSKTSADIHNLLGKAHGELNEADAADSEFRAAIELNPYDEQYHFDLASSLLRRQKFEAAIQVLQNARRNFNRSPQLELALGVACYGLRRYSEAAEAFERSIALSPNLEQPYLFLGKMMDQIPESVSRLMPLFESFEKAHPDNYAGYLLHAKALTAQSLEPRLSEALFRKASSLNPRAAEPHFELGVLLQKQRTFADAAREFENAAALDPADPATHYHLAQVYDRLGKRDAASAERERHARLMKTDPAR